VTSPIASATNMDQLAELTATVELSLDADDIAKIDEASK
jgi:aryl-alcohol dehydrogenase-like predicted oxidoreductase